MLYSVSKHYQRLLDFWISTGKITFKKRVCSCLKNTTVEYVIWKYDIWKLGLIGNTTVVKKLLVSSNMLTLLATLEFLALLWKLETVFQSLFVFLDSRFHGIIRCEKELSSTRIFYLKEAGYDQRKTSVKNIDGLGVSSSHGLNSEKVIIESSR
jgi:hypothetical protein